MLGDGAGLCGSLPQARAKLRCDDSHCCHRLTKFLMSPTKERAGLLPLCPPRALKTQEAQLWKNMETKVVKIIGIIKNFAETKVGEVGRIINIILPLKKKS